MMRRFDLESFLNTIEKYEVTELSLVPPMIFAILMSPYAQKGSFLRKVKAVACGAAPLDKEAQAKFSAMTEKGAPVTQVWGMTETSCIATRLPYPECDNTGSVGRLIPNLEAKYV